MGLLENKFNDNVIVAKQTHELVTINITLVFSVRFSLLCNRDDGRGREPA